MTQSIKNIIAAVLISLSTYLFWTKALPMYNYTSELKVVIIEKQSLVESRKKIFESIQGYVQEKNKRSSELQRLSLLMPDKKEIPEIITSMEATFLQTGNLLTELRINEEKNPKPEAKLIKILIETKSAGEYEANLKLLALLEKNLRIIDINTVEMGLDKRTGLITTMIRGDAYFINSNRTAAKASPPPPSNKNKNTD